VGYEARQTTQAVAQSQDIAEQLTVAADKASAAADLAAIAYTEGEMPLGSLLQARRQAGESQLSATLAQVSAHEARARALLDAHLLWTPSPLEAQGPP
jgi:tripartite-type tricarboxylate transporter receptor subunit TctC